MRSLFILFFCLASMVCVAQDLTGVWRGHFESENYPNRLLPSSEGQYKFEVQLGQDAKQFQGVTYSYHTTTFYGKASCYGSVNPLTKKVFLEETKILEFQSAGGVACIMTCFLKYSKVGKEEILEGHYTSMNTSDSTQCGQGTVYLRRVENSDFHKEPFLVEAEKKKNETKITPYSPPPAVRKNPPVAKSTKPAPTPVKPPVAKPKPSDVSKKPSTATAKRKPSPKPATANNDMMKTVPQDTAGSEPTKLHPSIMVPQVLATRTNEVVKTISTPANQITIKIYDNGTVDNDTVSVYLDKKLVISNARLTEKPIILKFGLDDKLPVHELVMVAENLGEIPPNTSLMVVTAGDQEIEVHITSTEQKNAVVIFRHEPKK